MLQHAAQAESRKRSGRIADVSIVSLATAVPAHKVAQPDMIAQALRVFPQFAHWESLYANTGVRTRYNCEPLDWYLTPHTWEQRTEVYQRHALDLLTRVAVEATERAGLRLEQVDALVVNTITGFVL